MTYRVRYDYSDEEWKVEKDAFLGYNTVRSYDTKKPAVKKARQFGKAKEEDVRVMAKSRKRRTTDEYEYS